MKGKPGCASALTHWWGCRTAQRPLRTVSVFIVLAAAFFLAAGHLRAAEGDSMSDNGSAETAAKATRYRVFSLRYIPADKAKHYLAELGTGTVSQLPGANMLLVTGAPEELTRASSVLGLIDSKQEYVMQTIVPAWSMKDHSPLERTAASITDVILGTLSNPPVGMGQPKAIVDVHNGALIAIAPAGQIERIVSAFGKAPTSANGKMAAGMTGAVLPFEPQMPVEPNKSSPLLSRPQLLNDSDFIKSLPGTKPSVTMPAKTPGLEETATSSEPATGPDANETDTDILFAKLLESIAEAEKKAAGQQAEANEPPAAPPNEPRTVVVPQPTTPNEPEIVVAPVPTPTIEPPKLLEPGSESLKDIALGQILKRLEALEAAKRAEAQPKTEETPPGVGPKGPPQAPEKIVSVIEPNEVPEAPEKTTPKVEHPNEPNALPPAAEELKPLTEDDEVLKVTLPETLPIIDFVNFVGQYLKLNYLYDPKELVGNVTFRINGRPQGEILVSELYPMLQNVMKFYGFVMIRNENLVIIRTKEKMDTGSTTIVSAEQKVSTGDVVVTRVFDLQHIDTASAKNLLDQMKLGLSIMPIAETGNLIVTGYNDGMPRIEQLLELVDVPGEPKQFKFRKLKYTMAEVLAPKVKTLAEQLGTISVTISVGAPAAPVAAPRRPARPSRPARPAGPQPPAPGAQPTAGKPTVYLEADERANRFLMIGLADELAVVNDLIDALDVAKEDLRTLRLYEIKNVDAEEVRRKLEELEIVSVRQTQTGRLPSRRERITGTGASRAARARAGQPAAAAAGAPSTTALPETAEGPLLEEPQVVIIETINALLVNATPEQHIQIATIIGYVDSEAETDVFPYVIYRLENQDPEELATVLNQLVQETVTAATGRPDADAKVTQPTTTTQKRTEEDIIIIPDKNTFSLIVYASKKNQQWIQDLITKLDVRRPQVLIDVTLVQIQKVDTFNMTLSALSAIPDAGFVSDQTGVNTNIFDKLTGSDRSSFREFASSPTLLGGGFQGFYGDKAISVLLTAIQEKSYGRVMDRPKLLVNDNETGIIETVETTYVRRTTTNVIGTDNPTSTEAVVFDDYSAGITLEITPHISEGDMLRLEVSLNRSGFTSLATGERPPDKADSDITTVVTVPDKSTIILGGVEKLQTNKGGVKIPILGDLPLIGGLFRNVARDDSQDKTYVFVKAHILRPGRRSALADLKEVSRANREAFENLETEMGDYQDWPGLKPYPLDPVRILEAE